MDRKNENNKGSFKKNNNRLKYFARGLNKHVYCKLNINYS